MKEIICKRHRELIDKWHGAVEPFNAFICLWVGFTTGRDGGWFLWAMFIVWLWLSTVSGIAGFSKWRRGE